MKALRWVAATLVVVVLAVPAAAQVTPDDVEDAKQRVAELQGDLDGAVVRYNEALTRYNILEGDIAQMSAAIEDTEARLERSRRLLEDRAIEIYMGAASTGASILSLSATPEELETGVGYLEELGVSEKELLTGLQAQEAELATLNTELAEARAEQAALRDELGGLVTEIDGQLRTAQDDYETVQAELAAQIEAERRAREEAERRAREQAARDATSTTAPAVSDRSPFDRSHLPTTPPADDPPTPTCGRRRRILPGTRTQQLFRHLGRPPFGRPLPHGSRHHGRPRHPGGGGLRRFHLPLQHQFAGRVHHLLPGQLREHLLLRASRRLRRRRGRRRAHGRRGVARLRGQHRERRLDGTASPLGISTRWR